MRSKWKGNFINFKSYNNFFNNSSKVNLYISRNSIINYKFEQTYFLVHNGRFYFKIKVVRKSINFKFGEFSLTRELTRHIK